MAMDTVGVKVRAAVRSQVHTAGGRQHAKVLGWPRGLASRLFAQVPDSWC